MKSLPIFLALFLLTLIIAPTATFADDATPSATIASTGSVTPTVTPTPEPTATSSQSTSSSTATPTPTPTPDPSKKKAVLGAATKLGSTGDGYQNYKWVFGFGIAALVVLSGFYIRRANHAEE